MDELAAIYKTVIDSMAEITQLKEQQMRDLRAILWGPDSVEVKEKTDVQVEAGSSTPATKRPKRLSALEENEDEIGSTSVSSTRRSSRNRTSASSTIAEPTSTKSHEEDIPDASEAPCVLGNEERSAGELMPPPSVPVNANISEQSLGRPQRAAKINCEKHLKEQPLNRKIRRGPDGEVEIKLEHEQRLSQMHESKHSKKALDKTKSNVSIGSTNSQDSVIVIPNKTPSIVSVDHSDQSSVSNDLEKSQSSENTCSTVQGIRPLSVRIKREKFSEIGANDTEKNNLQRKGQKETTAVESSIFSTTTTSSTISGNTTNDVTQTKKGLRKKKVLPKPIKVERFSDDDFKKANEPIAEKTHNSNKNSSEPKEGQQKVQTEAKTNEQNTTIYEEAVENQEQPKKSGDNSSWKPQVISETIAPGSAGTPSNTTIVLGAAPNDATYCTAAAATFVVDPQNPQSASGGVVACSDLTFNMPTTSKDGTDSQRSSEQSMATARDTLQPRAESLMTEDDSDQETPAIKPVPKTKMNTLPFSASKKGLLPAKSYKLPVREIFNPLIQSPVKKKVEAFENVAAANKNTRNARSKLAKENSKPASSLSTTPLIGKTNSVAGRYLTPTQSVNLVTPNAMGAIKKVTASASKAIGLTKSNSADKVWLTSSAKAPAREHSAEDFRRGTQQMAEERKKQRDQRHLQAAQQREAKERERAERLAKAAKEREEKRLKKQQLAEQKQRELQEIQRKLKQQEEAQAAAAAAEVAAQKEKLMKISQLNSASGSAKLNMLPPQPRSKYTFEMLHEDDSTDDEGKVTYKRPPPPTWSLSHVRGPAILAQEHMSKEPVDCFFSVQPRTLDLKIIFPKIDPRFLKRNSSAIWQTPPRYSELPKY